MRCLPLAASWLNALFVNQLTIAYLTSLHQSCICARTQVLVSIARDTALTILTIIASHLPEKHHISLVVLFQLGTGSNSNTWAKWRT